MDLIVWILLIVLEIHLVVIITPIILVSGWIQKICTSDLIFIWWGSLSHT